MKDLIINNNYYFDENMDLHSKDKYVNSKGGSKRLVKGKKLTTNKSKDGHITVNISRKTYYLHRLVYETFIGDIPEGYVIHHIDHNKENNRPENLEKLTIKEHNDIHHTKNGSKIDIELIIKLYEQGYKKIEIAKMVNCHKTTVYKYLKRKG